MGATAGAWLIGAVVRFSAEVALLAAGYVMFVLPCTVVPQIVPHDDIAPQAYLLASFFAAATVTTAWGNVLRRSARGVCQQTQQAG